MSKKLFIVLFLCFAGQLFSAHANRVSLTANTSVQTKENTLKGKLRQHPFSELELVHSFISNAVRVIPAREDSTPNIGLITGMDCPGAFPGALSLTCSTSFSKSYIDHIYPSHHFW
jgi:hypothetical protein